VLLLVSVALGGSIPNCVQPPVAGDVTEITQAIVFALSGCPID
jgi:hypothetical protein